MQIKFELIIGIFVAKLELLDNPPLYASTGYGYTTLGTYTDSGAYSRILPPVPTNCPTALGVNGIVNVSYKYETC